MAWDVRITTEAKKDYMKLDKSLRKQVLAGIIKVSKAPLPSPHGYGKPLGNRQGNNLTGFFKIKYRGIGIGHGLISALKKDLLDNHKEVSYILVYPKSWSDFSDKEDDLLTNEDLYSVYESLGFEFVNLKADRSHPNQEMHQIIRKE